LSRQKEEPGQRGSGPEIGPTLFLDPSLRLQVFLGWQSDRGRSLLAGSLPFACNYKKNYNNQAGMNYEWDEAKNRSNMAKHGLNFEDAAQVFDGPCVTFEDDRFPYGEERFLTLGLLAQRLVVIAHSSRDEATRIISMRKGNRREQKIHQERLRTD
jgi:hypothetical protein